MTDFVLIKFTAVESKHITLQKNINVLHCNPCRIHLFFHHNTEDFYGGSKKRCYIGHLRLAANCRRPPTLRRLYHHAPADSTLSRRVID